MEKSGGEERWESEVVERRVWLVVRVEGKEMVGGCLGG